MAAHAYSNGIKQTAEDLVFQCLVQNQAWRETSLNHRGTTDPQCLSSFLENWGGDPPPSTDNERVRKRPAGAADSTSSRCAVCRLQFEWCECEMLAGESRDVLFQPAQYVTGHQCSVATIPDTEQTSSHPRLSNSSCSDQQVCNGSMARRSSDISQRTYINYINY